MEESTAAESAANALQISAVLERFPEAAELLTLFDELPEQAQKRCRRRVRQIVIEASRQTAETGDL